MTEAQPDTASIHFGHGAGREYTFGQFLRIALQQFRLNLWPTTLCTITLGIGFVMLIAALLFVGFVVGVLLNQALQSFAGLPESPATEISVWGIGVPVLVAVCACGTALYVGYQWAAIRSFDRMPIHHSDVFSGIRSGYGRSLLVYGLLFGLFHAATRIATRLPILGVLASFANGILTLFTLMIGPIIMMDPKPRFKRALMLQMKLIRLQPKRMILLAFLPTIARCAFVLPLHIVLVAEFLGLVSRGVYYGLFWGSFLFAEIATLVFWTYYQFLTAVVIRAAYGLSIDLPTSPEPWRHLLPHQ